MAAAVLAGTAAAVPPQLLDAQGQPIQPRRPEPDPDAVIRTAQTVLVAGGTMEDAHQLEAAVQAGADAIVRAEPGVGRPQADRELRAIVGTLLQSHTPAEAIRLLAELAQRPDVVHVVAQAPQLLVVDEPAADLVEHGDLARAMREGRAGIDQAAQARKRPAATEPQTVQLKHGVTGTFTPSGTNGRGGQAVNPGRRQEREAKEARGVVTGRQLRKAKHADRRAAKAAKVPAGVRP
jgi:hypothetical protein